VVVVVTATPVPAPAAPAPEKPQAPPPIVVPGKPQAPAPTAIQPVAPPPAAGRPAASPPALQSPTDATVARVTTAAGRPNQLRCLGERVTVMADAEALPPGLTLTCGPVDPASVPPPPNPVVNGTLFRLEVAPADGNALKG